jgi:hypothetical protein
LHRYDLKHQWGYGYRIRYMRKKLVGFAVAAFVAALVASPALAAKAPTGGGRAGSTIIANRT